MSFQLNPFWASCPWCKLAIQEPFRLSQPRRASLTLMPCGTSTIRAVSRIRCQEKETGAGCGTPTHGRWVGLGTCESTDRTGRGRTEGLPLRPARDPALGIKLGIKRGPALGIKLPGSLPRAGPPARLPGPKGYARRTGPPARPPTGPPALPTRMVVLMNSWPGARPGAGGRPGLAARWAAERGAPAEGLPLGGGGGPGGGPSGRRAGRPGPVPGPAGGLRNHRGAVWKGPIPRYASGDKRSSTSR